MKTKKGFTLVELLIVIAIIGVLSEVVIGSVNSARIKGANAAVKQSMHGLTDQAEIVYDQNSGRYTTGLCTDDKIRSLLDSAGNAGSGVPSDATCNSDDAYWVAESPFKGPDSDGNTYWCVDNNGVAKGETSALDPSATACP